MKWLMKYAVLLVALVLTSGCANSTVTSAGTETKRAICEVWGASLPTRSRLDTEQTRKEVGESYATFAAVCPDYVDLIP